MSELSNWSRVAAGNNESPPDGWPEGMLPSQVNNTAREDRAALAREFQTRAGKARTGGSGNIYTLTLDEPHTFSTLAGRIVSCTFDRANTGISWLNVNSLGAREIRRVDGSLVEPDDLPALDVDLLFYDGNHFTALTVPVDVTAATTALNEYLETVGATATAGTGSDFTLTYDDDSVSSLSSITGRLFGFKADRALIAGSAPRMNINGTGNLAVVDLNGDAATWSSNEGLLGFYDGSNFVVLKQGALDAGSVTADTTNFDGLLSSTDTDVQTALETLDEVGASEISVDVASFDGLLGDTDTDAQAALETLDDLDLGTQFSYASPDLDTTIPSDININTYFAPTLTIPPTGFIKFEINSEPSQLDPGPTFLPAIPCGAIRDLTAATAASAVGSGGEPITLIVPSTTTSQARFLIGRTSANGLLLAVTTTGLRSAGLRAWTYDT